MQKLKLGQKIAHKNATGENSHIISLVKIIGFDNLAIHVQGETGVSYYINSWDIVKYPVLSK